MEQLVVRRLPIKLVFLALLSLLATSCGSGQNPAALPSEIDSKLKRIIDERNLSEPPAKGLTLRSVNQAEAKLGKRLFFSTLLSGKKDTACASCHHPKLLGTENLSLPVGINSIAPNVVGLGRRHNISTPDDIKANGAPNVARHSPTTFNSALYRKALFWDGRIEKHPEEKGIITPESLNVATVDAAAQNTLLATQALFPLTSTQEMKGLHGSSDPNTVRGAIISRLISESSTSNHSWVEDFRLSFNLSKTLPATEVITKQRLADALAAYQESQLFINNAWAEYMKGDMTAISESAKKGALLFYSSQQEGGLACAQCHSGPHFSDEKFYPTAFPQLGRGKGSQGSDYGRFLATKQEKDRHSFRTPSLLNSALTSPYGHSGSFTDLASTLRYHLKPKLDDFDFTLSTLPQFSGSGFYYPLAKENTRAAIDKFNKSLASGADTPLPANASSQQLKNIEDFLGTLSDQCLVAVTQGNTQCLSPWLLDSSEMKIDSLLRAKFNVPANNSLGWGSPESSLPISTTPPVTSGANINVNTCISNTKTTDSSELLFSEVSQAAGISFQIPLADIATINNSQTELFPKLDLLNSASFSGAVIGADINNDSYPDLLTYQGPGAPLGIHLNNKNGTFSTKTSEFGLPDFSDKHIYGIASADLDGDKDIDLVVTGRHLSANQLFTTEGFMDIYKFDGGQWVFQPQVESVSYPIHSVSFSDYNSDQQLDINIASWSLIASDKKENHLWKNTGAFEYSPADVETGLATLMPDRDFTFIPLSTDLDGNFHPDLVQISDFGNSSSFFNNGSNQFISQNSNQHKNELSDDNGMGAVSADFNNDGHMDIFVSSIYGAELTEAFRGTGNRLYMNDGAGKLTDISTDAGLRNGRWGWGACAADFNLDGHLDIFHVNGFGGLIVQDPAFKDSPYYSAFLKDKSKLFISNGDMTFTESAVALGIDDESEGRGIVCFDYDRDGDTDIFINVNHGKPKLYQNRINNGSKSIVLDISDQQSQNTQAIGAKIKISNQRTGESQYREIQANSNYQSQNPTTQLIGLGDSDDKYDIEITWPRPLLNKSVIENAEAGQCLQISRQAP